MRVKTILLTLLFCSIGAIGSRADDHSSAIEPEFGSFTTLASRSAEDNDTFVWRDVTVDEAGNLASVLGDDILTVDSLVVRGAINDEDFTTLWSGSLYGSLSVINLENAEIEGGKVPDNAFYKAEQYGDGVFYVVQLRRMILPDAVCEIGDNAFTYAVDLENVNIPSDLKSIGNAAFFDCLKLNDDRMIFPEGFVSIGKRSFAYCGQLSADIVLPSSIRTIGAAAFYGCRIRAINLPEGLETIGELAFSNCRMSDLTIPGSCSLVGDSQFSNCYDLVRVTVSEGVTLLPEAVFDNCMNLAELSLPSSLETIDEAAFRFCSSLPTLVLPEGLRRIGQSAFEDCRGLRTIALPTTTEFLDRDCFFYCTSVREIYCAATTPPTCNMGPEDVNIFDSFNGVPMDATLYVPFGTAEAYRDAYGWCRFENIVEVDTFPTSELSVIRNDGHYEDSGMIYDLSGRVLSHPAPGQFYIRGGRTYRQGR